MSTDPVLTADTGTVWKESLPAFQMRKADPAGVPSGVTYAGIIRTPDGTFGIHAYVRELDDGHKEFIGGLFRVDE